jgi:hypothetical protein
LGRLMSLFNKPIRLIVVGDEETGVAGRRQAGFLGYGLDAVALMLLYVPCGVLLSIENQCISGFVLKDSTLQGKPVLKCSTCETACREL